MRECLTFGMEETFGSPLGRRRQAAPNSSCCGPLPLATLPQTGAIVIPGVNGLYLCIHL